MSRPSVVRLLSGSLRCSLEIVEVGDEADEVLDVDHAVAVLPKIIRHVPGEEVVAVDD